VPSGGAARLATEDQVDAQPEGRPGRGRAVAGGQVRPVCAVERVEPAFVVPGHVRRDRHPLQVGGGEGRRAVRAGEQRVRLRPLVPPEGLVGAREIVCVHRRRSLPSRRA
jgi:hypothetical protein